MNRVRRWAQPPLASDYADSDNSDEEVRERHDPGDTIEAGTEGRGDDNVAVLRDEILVDRIVSRTVVDEGGKAIAHSSRVRTSDVIAFQQYLIASAGAHECVSDAVIAWLPSSDGKERDSEDYNDAESSNNRAVLAIANHRQLQRFRVCR